MLIKPGVAHYTFFCSRKEPDGALYTLDKCYTLWDYCPNTYTFSGQVMEELLPPYSLLPGVSTPPPCQELVKMPARSHLGEDNPCDTWWASVSITPGPRRSPLTRTQWHAACRQTRAGTDNIVNRAEWQTGLSGQRGMAAAAIGEYPLFYFFLLSRRLSTENFISLFSTSQRLSAKVFGSDILELRVLPFTAGYESRKNTRTPLPPVGSHPPLIFNLTQATMSAHCSKIMTLFHFCFHSSGY